MQNTDMKKEIRAERRILVRAQNKILRDFRNATKAANRQITQYQRAIARAQKSSGREYDKIQRRIAILDGRLS
jgi:uncharacterized protein YlxW (UPF0749 family)